jgi:hypothetical protein
MIVPEDAMDFNRLEREVYKLFCSLGREMLQNVLEAWDKELQGKRDNKEYRHKGQKRTSIKTIMGEVEYTRAIYERKQEDGTKQFVYLLDEAMGIQGSGQMSGLLCEQIVLACCDNSYRSGARSVSELTGQTVSHTAAWNVVQNIGSTIGVGEEEAAGRAKKSRSVGTLETKVLFEEMDGIWLHLQGESRKKHGKSREMKLAIAYDGARKVVKNRKKNTTGKIRYELTNKVACANFEEVGSFLKRKEGVIAETYNIDEIEHRFLNGDGAGWIKSSIANDEVHFQLDPYHRNKELVRLVHNSEIRKELSKLLHTKQIDLLLTCIEAYSNSVEDEIERDDLLQLLTYYTNNRDGLISYKRRGLSLPEAPDGKEYRNMGAMESNVFTIIGNRMKGRRACWSINGGNNLARLLCLKTTNALHDKLQNLGTGSIPEKYAEEVTVRMSAAKVPEFEGHGYNGFKQMLVPSSMKWIKDIAAIKPLY